MNEHNRRQVLQLAIGAALGGAWSRAGAAEPPPETARIRIQQAAIACFAPLYIAEALLKAEGFTEVEYVKTPEAEGPGRSC